MKAQTTHKMMKAKQRADFMEAGGYDGRFRTKTVKSKKQYSRKEKHKGKGFND